MLVQERTGQLRYKDYLENEVLHGFERDHTRPAFSSKRRRLDPVGALDARGRLLGGCFHPMVVAFLLGELAVELGLVQEGVHLDELVQLRVRLVPRPGTSALSACDEPWQGRAADVGLQ